MPTEPDTNRKIFCVGKSALLPPRPFVKFFGNGRMNLPCPFDCPADITFLVFFIHLLHPGDLAQGFRRTAGKPARNHQADAEQLLLEAVINFYAEVTSLATLMVETIINASSKIARKTPLKLSMAFSAALPAF